MSNWDQANKEEKLGLFWRNKKKINQIINDYLYLPFFLIIYAVNPPHGCAAVRAEAIHSEDIYV
jgi:hypothetical protein